MLSCWPLGAAAGPLSVAVVDFDYFDTSFEPRDQSADHARRMQEFMSALRRDLAKQAGYRIVVLVGDGAPCAVSKTPPGELFAAAKKGGARLVF